MSAQEVQFPGSGIPVPGLSCSKARAIFPDLGSNPCPLHWQVDSLPLTYQESPVSFSNQRYLSPTSIPEPAIPLTHF